MSANSTGPRTASWRGAQAARAAPGRAAAAAAMMPAGPPPPMPSATAGARLICAHGMLASSRPNHSLLVRAGGQRLVAAMEAVDALIGTFTDDFGRAVAHGAPRHAASRERGRCCSASAWRSPRAPQCARRWVASATRRWASWTRRGWSWSRCGVALRALSARIAALSPPRAQARAALSAERERFEAQRQSERVELDRAWQARPSGWRLPVFRRKAALSRRIAPMARCAALAAR